VVVAFGLIGFGLERARVPLGPFVIGFVLEPLFESELRAALQISGGDYLGVLDRPIATGFVLVAAVMMLWPAIQARRRKSRNGARATE
jgi:putative tricarboxylic transport membrane protein